MYISHTITITRFAMQWEEHSSREACKLVGGGVGQEGGPRLRGADAGRPHQEPGGTTSLADIKILPIMFEDQFSIRVWKSRYSVTVSMRKL